MGYFSKFGPLLFLLSSACIVEDDNLRIPDQANQQTAQKNSKRSNKKVVGAKQADPKALKVEISLFESVQPNPVMARMAKGRGQEAMDKVCRWSKVDNNMKQFTHSIFPGQCADIIHIGWHPVYEGRSLVSVGRDLYAVSGAEAKPLPEVPGRPYDVGMTSEEGGYLVRTSEAKVPTTQHNGATGVEVDGNFIAGGSGDTATVYRSFRYEDEAWKQVEMLVNDANERPPRSDDWTSIGLTTTSMHPGVHGVEPREATSEERLALTKASPSQDSELNWQIASTKNGEVAWTLAGPAGDQPSLPLMHRKQGKWSHIQPIRYKVSEGITLDFRSGYLLVTRVGTRPYVYDLGNNKIAYKSITASGVLFWPHFDRTKSTPDAPAK